MKNSSQSYLREVQNQIHSKEAKEYVSTELNHHIKEVKKEWIKKGVKEADAEVKAVEQMGSPVALGQKLNKLHRPKVDWLTVILLLVTLGLGFLPLSLENSFSNIGYYSIHKFIFVLLGGVVAIGMMFIDYRKLEKLGWLFYVIGMLILIALKFFPSQYIQGVPSIKAGPLTIEILMALPFFFLGWASFFNDKRLKLWHLGILFFLSCYILIGMPSISVIYIYVVTVFVMFCWSQYSRKTILKTLGITVSLFVSASIILWQSAEQYQKLRLVVFLKPEQYADSEGYMILLLKEKLAEAGWFGNSMTNGFIPDGHTNFVFVSLTSYFGWLFAIALVIILSLFIARIIVITRKIHLSYGKLLLIGSVAIYAVQLVTNIAMTLGFLPIITMSLPFMSYGLMPILLNSFLIGIVLSVYRRKDLVSSSFANSEFSVK